MCRKPTVGNLAYLTKALRAEPRNVNRNVGAQRLEAEFESMKLKALALEVDRFTCEKRPYDMNGFSNSRERLVVWDAVKVFDDSRAARSQTQAKSPARDFIERRRAHRDQSGAPREDVDDSGAEMNALGVSGEFSQNCECFAFPRLRHPERIVAANVGGSDAFDQLSSIEATFVESGKSSEI